MYNRWRPRSPKGKSVRSFRVWGKLSRGGVSFMGTRFDGVILLVISIAATMPAFGQTFGQITGLVTDSSGGVIAHAAVTVTNPEINLIRTENTNAAGVYNFPNLLPGIYNVKVEIQGFQAEIRSNVELQ